MEFLNRHIPLLFCVLFAAVAFAFYRWLDAAVPDDYKDGF